MTSNITGTWFPSGFHGYTKIAESRNDVNTLYRQLAKPLPPNKFMWRVTQPPSKHVFSIHDNRKAFKGDAHIFGKGLGRKHIDSAYYCSYDGVLPRKFDTTHLDSSWPYLSTYKKTFHLDHHKYPPPNIFHVTASTLHNQRYGITTYQISHGNANPYDEFIQKKEQDLGHKCKPPFQRPKTAPPILQESVALCLRWEKPHVQRPAKENASTSTTSLIVSKDKATQI
ncbi:uncharacterized protein C3orf84-like isoform X1 [Octopus sinensis]|uniref:Uncharacterized protein C3orf84-like isoform X1 n=2 Tax=Octopus sinensis TaxID=2607531 RepID=A0A6P7SC79_9MOLL|nr:uncharacterized protein C3orf84-like isoform X1 [Octopus sinensis]